MPPQSDDVRPVIIKQLRDEAYAVRDCFTRYSFSALSVAVLGLGVIAKFALTEPYLGVLSVLPVLLLLAVASMGTHKYATSNRLLGYELHLHRTRHYIGTRKWQPHMQAIGWEEAMRAWRIVQATLFEHIYRTQRTSLSGRQEKWRFKGWVWRFWRSYFWCGLRRS